MLEKVDLSKVFNTARARGYTHIELYAESRLETDIALKGRLQETRLNSQKGISISLSDGQSRRHLWTNQITTPAILSLMDETPVDFLSHCAEESGSLDNALLKERVQNLKAALRKSGANLDSSLAPILRYEEVIRQFEVCTDPHSIHVGKEENARAGWEFGLNVNEGARKIQDSIARSSVNSFWDDFQEDTLIPTLPKSWFNPWPSPKGMLSVVWKPRAVAQLLLPFLRAFEGDLVLKKMSILHQIENKLPLHFKVQDAPDVLANHFDHEGSPLLDTTLFSHGTPQTVACDKLIAGHLRIASTGHARRESYQAASCIGLWNAHLIGDDGQEEIISKLARGICIEDIQIVEFNPFSGVIQIIVKDAFLVHHGEEGEALVPVKINASLISLLSSMTTFGKTTKRFGCTIKKQGQDILTEINAPLAFSPELEYPGEVSPNHYW